MTSAMYCHNKEKERRRGGEKERDRENIERERENISIISVIPEIFPGCPAWDSSLCF